MNQHRVRPEEVWSWKGLHFLGRYVHVFVCDCFKDLQHGKWIEAYMSVSQRNFRLVGF